MMQRHDDVARCVSHAHRLLLLFCATLALYCCVACTTCEPEVVYRTKYKTVTKVVPQPFEVEALPEKQELAEDASAEATIEALVREIRALRAWAAVVAARAAAQSSMPSIPGDDATEVGGSPLAP